MNLRKIAAIFALVVAIVGSTVAAVLDLPVGTPGIQPTTQDKVINKAHNVPCIHVIIPNTAAWRAFKREVHDDLYEGMAEDGNLYFPTNGVQPTSREATEYSCANVGAYDLNSPITEWYMRMFGWIPEDDNRNGASHDHASRLKIGFNKDNQVHPIIILHINGISNADTGLFIPQGRLTRRQSFWYVFRQIASNPVGRVLLYRILIEVRRQTADTCIPQSAPQINSMRSQNRRLYVEWSTAGSFAYRPAGNPSLSFGENAALAFNSEMFATPQGVRSSCIGQKINANSIAIVRSDTSCAIGTFHELNHWYHLLRYPKRYIDERSAFNGAVKLNGKDTNGVTQINLGNLYWPYDEGNILGFANKWRISALPWLSNYFVNFEEVRNILGSRNTTEEYKEGDDLSENLYRSSIGYPIRFGHDGSISYWEDTEVINRVRHACSSAINNHGWDYNLVNFYGTVPFTTTQELLLGIGGCVHSKPVLNLTEICPKGG